MRLGANLWFLGALVVACESQPLPPCPEHASPPPSGCPELRDDGCPENWLIAEKLPCEHEGKHCPGSTPDCVHESYFVDESISCSNGRWTYWLYGEGECGGESGL